MMPTVIMNDAAMNEALELLDIQYKHAKYTKMRGKIVPVNTIENQRQDAYYSGMRVMLEFILTNGYRKNGCITRGIVHRYEEG